MGNMGGGNNAEQQGSAGHCVTCRRFIGNERQCPYCESPQPRTHASLFLVIVALTSLAALWLSAQRIPPAFVPPDAIHPHMNFARIQTAGILHRERNAYGQRLSLHAHGNELQIQFSNRADLPDYPITPGPITVTGQLRIRAGEPPTLYIRNRQDLVPMDAPRMEGI